MQLVLVGHVHPDAPGIQQVQQDALVSQVGTGGIAKGIAAAAIALLQHLAHVAGILMAEAQLAPDATVDIFRQRLSHLH